MRLLAGIFSLLASGGCWVGSIQPYYTEYSDLKDGHDLIGFWEAQSGDCGGKKGNYKPPCLLTIVHGPKSSAIVATVHDESGFETSLTLQEFDVDGARFLDATLLDDSNSHDSLLRAQHLIATHSLWKVNLDGETLAVSRMNEDYLKEILEPQSGSPEVAFVDLHDSVILTASSASLRRFMGRHATDPRLFTTKRGANQLVFVKKIPVTHTRALRSR